MTKFLHINKLFFVKITEKILKINQKDVNFFEVVLSN